MKWLLAVLTVVVSTLLVSVTPAGAWDAGQAVGTAHERVVSNVYRDGVRCTTTLAPPAGKTFADPLTSVLFASSCYWDTRDLGDGPTTGVTFNFIRHWLPTFEANGCNLLRKAWDAIGPAAEFTQGNGWLRARGTLSAPTNTFGMRTACTNTPESDIGTDDSNISVYVRRYGNFDAPSADKRLALSFSGTPGVLPEYPAMPDHFYPGGVVYSAPPEHNAEVTAYDCGRTLADAGAGKYFVDASAFLHTALQSNQTDTLPRWRGSWETAGIFHDGLNARMITPDIATIPLDGIGWYATFESTRTFTTTYGAAISETEAFKFPDPAGGGGFVWIPKWLKAKVDAEFASASENIRANLYPYLKFLNGTTQVDQPFGTTGGGDWNVVKVYCRVRVDPTTPGSGQSSSTYLPGNSTAVTYVTNINNPPTDTTAPAPGEGAECSGASGWSILNPLNIGRWIACKLGGLLRTLFIPDELPWSDATAGIGSEFPFSVVSGLGTASATVTSWATSSTGGGNGCAGLDLNNAVTAIAHRPVGGVAFRMPTPSDSGCPGMGVPTRTVIDNTAGDLWGYRVWLRTLILLLVWFALGRRVIRSWSPAGADAEAMIG